METLYIMVAVVAVVLLQPSLVALVALAAAAMGGQKALPLNLATQ
jgi:hypothetical protein